MRSRNATIALYVGGFMGPFGGAVLSVLVPELQESFHATRDAVAASIPAYLIPFAALQLVSGTIGERLGRHARRAHGFIAYAVGSLIAAAAPTLTIFVAARFVQGASNAFLTPLLLATLAELVPPAAPDARDGHVRERADRRALARAADRRRCSRPCNWRLAFVVSAAVARRAGGASPRAPRAPPPPRRARPSVRSLRTRRLGLLCGAAFLGYATVAGVGYMVSFYARDRMGLGPLERGVVLACFGAAGFVLGRPLGAAVQRIGRVPSVIIGAALLGRLRRAARLQHVGLAARGAVDARRRRLGAALDRAQHARASRPCPRTAAARRACSAPSASPAARSRPTSSCRSTTTRPSHAFVACALAACVIVPLALAIRAFSAEPVRPRPYPSAP